MGFLKKFRNLKIDRREGGCERGVEFRIDLAIGLVGVLIESAG
jgi:hypothetical protein